MIEQSSPTSPTPLAFFDNGDGSPESWCWRTSQASLLSAVPGSLERLPAWGTTSDGVLFELPTPVRLTAGRDGSASLPTPRSFMAHMADRPLKIRDVYKCNLEEAIALLPTPRAQNGEPRNMKPWVRPLDQPQNLENAIARLLPTPAAWDGANNAGPSQWNRNSDPLNVVAVKLSGGATPQPFNDGNEPSAGPHPHPPTTGNSPADSSNG